MQPPNTRACVALPTHLTLLTLQGYVAVTPLYNPALNRTVLVNRGWVPASWLTDEAERAKGEPQGQVCGVLCCAVLRPRDTCPGASTGWAGLHCTVAQRPIHAYMVPGRLVPFSKQPSWPPRQQQYPQQDVHTHARPTPAHACPTPLRRAPLLLAVPPPCCSRCARRWRWRACCAWGSSPASLCPPTCRPRGSGTTSTPWRSRRRVGQRSRRGSVQSGVREPGRRGV